MPISAFSNIKQNRVPGEIFHSQYWDGSIARVYPSTVTNAYGISSITGTDSLGHGVNTLNTDFGVVGGTPTSRIEHILDAAVVADLDAGDLAASTAMIDAQNTITISSSTAPGGIGNQIEVSRLLRLDNAWTGRYPQIDCTLQFDNNKATPNRLYFTHMFKTPANLLDILARNDGYGAWIETMAWKSNDYTMNDSRLSLQIQRLDGETGCRFVSQFDNCGTRFTDGFTDNVILPFWKDRSDEGVITASTWYSVDLEFNRATGGKTDLVTGSYQCILTNLDTNTRYEIAYRRGANQLLTVDETKHPTLATLATYNPGVYWGYNNYPFTRFFTALAYTGGKASPDVFTMIYSNGEFWTKAPYILI